MRAHSFFKKSILVWLGLGLLVSFSLAFHLVSNHVQKVENGLIISSSVSVVHDGDLNLVNNLSPKLAWVVSPSGHFVNPEAWGSAIWLSPFLLYGRFMDLLGLLPVSCQLNNDEVALTLGATVAALLLFVVLFQILQQLGFQRLTGRLLVLFFLGTPLFWYGILEPSGSDLILALMLACLVLFFLKKGKHIRFREWFLVGLFLGLMVIVSRGALCYLLLPPLLFLLNADFRRQGMSALLVCLFGILVVFGIDSVNESLQWGSFHSITVSLLVLKSSFPSLRGSVWQSLFGANGGFFISPIYLLAFLGCRKPLQSLLTKLDGQSPRDALFSALSAVLVLDTIFSSNFLFEGDFFGGHQWLLHSAVLVWGLAELFRTCPIRWRAFLGFAVGIAVLWNLFWILEFQFDRELFRGLYYNLSLGQLADLFGHLGRTLLLGWPFFHSMVATYLVHELLLLGVFLFIGSRIRSVLYSSEKLLDHFFIFWFLIFCVITGLNYWNSPSNVARMREAGVYGDKVVGNGGALFFYDIAALELEKNVQRNQLNGHPDVMATYQIARATLFVKAKSEVVNDPAHIFLATSTGDVPASKLGMNQNVPDWNFNTNCH